MQHAILITAYKNLRQLTEIINFFEKGNFRFYIHIDKKTVIHPALLRELGIPENVKLVANEYAVNWGGTNHLKAILLLLEEAVKDNTPDYIHLITGQDFPIKTMDFFDEFLSQNNGAEFMEVNKLPYQNWINGGFDRILFYNFNDYIDARKGSGRFISRMLLGLQKLTGIKKKLPENFPPLYGGSTYWSITGKFGRHVLNYANNNPDFLKIFDFCFCAEELFFQTILMDSPFTKNLVNDNLRYMSWNKGNSNSPANLDISDYGGIRKSDALFARKFDLPASQELLNKVIEDLTTSVQE